MGIVNAGQLAVYEQIERELRDLCEDVVLARRTDAAERLLENATRYEDGKSDQGERAGQEWREWDNDKRLEHCAGERHHRVHRGRCRGIATTAGNRRCR